MAGCASGRLGLVPAPGRPTNDPDAAVRARAAGRPLDEAVDTAILNAAWRLLLEEGYSRLSIAGVAQAAKVGRPAIYRRYKDKSELVAAVIADKVANVPPIDTGTARDDLIAHLELAQAVHGQPRRNPDRRGAQPSRAARAVPPGDDRPPARDSIAEALERGKERGEIRADLDTQIASHALMGSFIFSYLAGGRPPKGWSESVSWPRSGPRSRPDPDPRPSARAARRGATGTSTPVWAGCANRNLETLDRTGPAWGERDLSFQHDPGSASHDSGTPRVRSVVSRIVVRRR